MAGANPLWGAPRIYGEILKLGLDVSERTVSRLMPKRRPEPSQTWRTFFANHARDLVSIDFFTVPTARLRLLFVLVVLAHHRRRVLPPQRHRASHRRDRPPFHPRAAPLSPGQTGRPRWPKKANCPTLDSLNTASYRS
jgi:hypothetical protein